MLRHVGTPLPDDLILVHEHTDHYSLQPAEEMSLSGNISWSLKHLIILNQTSSFEREDHRFFGKELNHLKERAVASGVRCTD